MNGWVALWHLMRISRWALWLGFLGYSLYFISNRAPHLTQFGNLKHSAEAMLFGLPLAAVIAGFLEIMARSKFTGPVADPKR